MHVYTLKSAIKVSYYYFVVIVLVISEPSLHRPAQFLSYEWSGVGCLVEIALLGGRVSKRHKSPR